MHVNISHLRTWKSQTIKQLHFCRMTHYYHQKSYAFLCCHISIQLCTKDNKEQLKSEVAANTAYQTADYFLEKHCLFSNTELIMRNKSEN